MTTVGEARGHYSLTVEARPSRFNDAAGYTAWATRADAHAARRRRFAAYLASEIAHAAVMA